MTVKITFAPHMVPRMESSQDDEVGSYVLYLDEPAYYDLKEGEPYVTLRDDQYRVFKFGPDGDMVAPTEQELVETFGTTDEKAVSRSILMRGQIKENPVEMQTIMRGKA